MELLLERRTSRLVTSSCHFLLDKMTVVAVGEDKVVHEQFAPFSLPVVDAPKP